MLVAIPCGDKDDCNEVNHSEISQNNNHEEHSGEVCTPFCSCACCSAHIIIKDFQPTLNYIAEVKPIYIIQPQSEITSVFISIWQPPKIS